jgi:hypothetical protein
MFSADTVILLRKVGSREWGLAPSPRSTSVLQNSISSHGACPLFRRAISAGRRPSRSPSPRATPWGTVGAEVDRFRPNGPTSLRPPRRFNKLLDKVDQSSVPSKRPSGPFLLLTPDMIGCTLYAMRAWTGPRAMRRSLLGNSIQLDPLKRVLASGQRATGAAVSLWDPCGPSRQFERPDRTEQEGTETTEMAAPPFPPFPPVQ